MSHNWGMYLTRGYAVATLLEEKNPMILLPLLSILLFLITLSLPIKERLMMIGCIDLTDLTQKLMRKIETQNLDREKRQKESDEV